MAFTLDDLPEPGGCLYYLFYSGKTLYDSGGHLHPVIASEMHTLEAKSVEEAIEEATTLWSEFQKKGYKFFEPTIFCMEEIPVEKWPKLKKKVTWEEEKE